MRDRVRQTTGDIPLSAPRPLAEGTYRFVRHKMLDYFDESVIDDEQVGDKGLFTTVMARICHLDPDVILFPAYSAVPLADAVDSFYEGIGKQRQTLSYIHANQNLARTTKDGAERRQRAIEMEVERLRSMHGGSKSVVMDHYTKWGNTLRLGDTMLASAGVNNLESFSPYSQWYTGVDDKEKTEMDLMTMSHPRHEKFMRDIGMRAAIRLRPRPRTSPQK